MAASTRRITTQLRGDHQPLPGKTETDQGRHGKIPRMGKRKVMGFVWFVLEMCWWLKVVKSGHPEWLYTELHDCTVLCHEVCD